MEGSELPAGWDISTLGEVAGKGQYGWTTKASTCGSVKLLRTTDITKGPVNWETVPFCQENPDEIDKYVLSPGDIVISRAGSVGFASLISEVPVLCVFASYLIRFSPNTLAIIPKYLNRFLHSPEYWNAISGASAGIALANVNASKLSLIRVPLAPLSEQRRIAAKLDTTLAAVEACRQRLDGVAAILKRFRQAVLAAATSGELTREWREKTGARAWTVEKATDACAKVQSGGTPKEGFIDEPGVPFLKVYNLVNQEVDFRYKPQFVRPEVHLGPLAKSRVMPGDVLMNIVGPPLGKVAIAPDDYDEWNINQAITLFRPSDKIRSRWIYCLLCEGTAIREIELRTKGSAGQVNISLTQCRDFDFPVPSIKEQDEIIERVEFLFSLAHELEAKLTAARRIADRLSPALLAKGFRGELVPQDPSDEPASVLLERVRAVRQADAATGKPSRRGRSKTAANPEKDSPPAAPAPPDLLAQLLQECGALSERALLAASELDLGRFRRQLALEVEAGNIREELEGGQQVLMVAGKS